MLCYNNIFSGTEAGGKQLLPSSHIYIHTSSYLDAGKKM